MDTYAYLILHALKQPFPKSAILWNEKSDKDRGPFTHENAVHKWDHILRIEMGKLFEKTVK